MATYFEDSAPSISAAGAALVALEEEYKRLDQDIEKLFARAGLAMQKQKILLESIRKIMLAANGGVFPPPCPERRFPELS